MTILKCEYIGDSMLNFAYIVAAKDNVMTMLKSLNYSAYLRKINDDLTFEIGISDQISSVILGKLREYFFDYYNVKTEVLE